MGREVGRFRSLAGDAGGPRRPGIAVIRTGETMMRAVAVFVGREVRGAAHRHYRPAAGSGR